MNYMHQANTQNTFLTFILSIQLLNLFNLFPLNFNYLLLIELKFYILRKKYCYFYHLFEYNEKL